MKRILVACLFAVGLNSSVLAQAPPASPTADSAVTKASHSGNGTCASCASCKTICVAEPSTKTIITPLYSKVSEPFCLCKLSLFGGRSCDAGCATANCGHVRTKHYLVVEPCVREQPVTVCRPVQVPCSSASPTCASSTTTAPSAVATVGATGSAETLPPLSPARAR